jgi:hypothetical protein
MSARQPVKGLARPSDADYMETARRLFQRDGEVEIDALAEVSCSDPEQGAYVQAWVWVRADQVQP